MATNELEEDLIIAIEEDDIDEFIKLTNTFKDWTIYLIKDEREYFIHYSISKKKSFLFFVKFYK